MAPQLGRVAEALGKPLAKRPRPGRPDGDLRLHLALAKAQDRTTTELTGQMAILHSSPDANPADYLIRLLSDGP